MLRGVVYHLCDRVLLATGRSVCSLLAQVLLETEMSATPLCHRL